MLRFLVIETLLSAGNILTLGATLASGFDAAPALTSISPAFAFNNGSILVTITGLGFIKTDVIALTREGYADLLPRTVEIAADEIICVFDLQSKPAGKWDVKVYNPKKPREAIMPGAFTIEHFFVRGGQR